MVAQSRDCTVSVRNLEIACYGCTISRLHSIRVQSQDCAISFACTIISQHSCVKNDVMLLFTRTTGERCSLPKYSIHNVLTVLVKPVITNALSHLFLRSCCFLHEQYTLTFSSLTISSDPILMLRSPHPGNGII